MNASRFPQAPALPRPTAAAEEAAPLARLGVDDLERQLERLHPASHAWALACCGGDRDEALEVVQGTYLRILDGRARFDGRASLKTWLFAVIRRVARRRRVRERLRRALLLRWAARAETPFAPDASARAVESEETQRIRHALARLSPRQRQVLELVFYHRLSIREAGEVLGVSIGTARAHYERGKRELEARLRERGTR